MHELSIAQNIISIISNSVDNDKLSAVERVSLRVGKLSNIQTDSLNFCFCASVENTPLNSCKLFIEHIPIKIECNDCNKIHIIDDFLFTCPSCSGSSLQVIEGDELIVTSIQLKDESGVLNECSNN